MKRWGASWLPDSPLQVPGPLLSARSLMPVAVSVVALSPARLRSLSASQLLIAHLCALSGLLLHLRWMANPSFIYLRSGLPQLVLQVSVNGYKLIDMA